MRETKEKIRLFMEGFVRKEILSEVDDTDDIFREGIVSSLFAMQLVTYIEKEFKITLTSEDFDLNNFQTVNKIAAFVVKKIEQEQLIGQDNE